MGASAYGGLFSGSNTYSKFDEQRNSYLEHAHYSRNKQQALNILQITTGDRAYTAYEACVRSIATGPALVVWASRETMDEIDLRVRYMNAPGSKEMDLYGTVTGGSVEGEPQGVIWSKGGVFTHNNRWGVNQERLFVIKRIPGTSETTVTVKAADGSAPFSESFKRADALLTLSYIGTVDALRTTRSASLPSPNNDEKKDSGCANYVGMHDGKYCTSRTTVMITTAAPRFLKNARSSCGGGNPCAYTDPQQPTASISPDQLTASTYIDNWSAPIDVKLFADEYEHLTVGATSCGAEDTIPVVKGQPVLFAAVSKECLPIAVLKWKRLGVLPSQGAVNFGYEHGPNNEVSRVTFIENGGMVLASYKLDK
jgi:hypothetical protein